MYFTIQNSGFYLLVLYCLIANVRTTEVKRCSGNKPFPLEVRVLGCEKSPCDVIKGEDAIFEIDFVAQEYFTKGTTLVRATSLGLTISYDLPHDVRDVCSNLMYGAYCPLYPTEDVTYLFVFPVGNYPEIGVKIEVYIVDQNNETATCFICDIKVKKGSSGDNDGKVIYELDWEI